MLGDQIEEISEANRVCPDCSKVGAIHDYRPSVLDTLFGRFQVKAPRSCRFECNAESEVTPGGLLSPRARFFPHRSTPEVQRLQVELAARFSCREAARMMEMFLPCAKQANTSVRSRFGKIAKEIGGSGYVEPHAAALR